MKITPEELEVGRKAVEDALIDLRDRRISQPFRGNGLVVREADGKASTLIRMGLEEALPIALEAIEKHRARREVRS